jgi:bacterial/archaeal transporter family-2 protein
MVQVLPVLGRDPDRRALGMPSSALILNGWLPTTFWALRRCYSLFSRPMKIQYYLLSVIAGVAVAFQTGVNSQLRTDTNNPVLTALISFVVGTVALAILYFSLFRQSPMFPANTDFLWWKFTGGLLGVLYVTAVVIAAPRIGAANSLAFIVAGQFVAAIIIDHYGWMRLPVNPVTTYRVLGIMLLLAGVYLIQKK